MEEYKKRIQDEKEQLDSKVYKLHAFMLSPKFKELDQHNTQLLVMQLHAMESYSMILGFRLSI